MKLRPWHWLVGIPAVLLIVSLVITSIHAAQDKANLKEQLRLARAEGLSTTAAEFAATIPSARPEENAAPFYRKLKGLSDIYKFKLPPTTIAYDLDWSDNSACVSDAKALLKITNSQLSIVDEAVKRPKCWFDRDWMDGAAVLMPEYSDMRVAARLLAMRGALAARRGDPAGAISDAERIFVISRHAGQEKHTISANVADSIYHIGLNQLAGWAFRHPSVRGYYKAFAAAVKQMPQADIKAQNRGMIVNVMSVVDLCSSEAGLRKLGLKPGEVQNSFTGNIFALVLSQPKAKVRIVEACREKWRSLDEPAGARGANYKMAELHLYGALLAFPAAAKLYEMLSSGNDLDDYDERRSESAQLEYVALTRAFANARPPRSIKTSDLASPYDNNPLDYSYDGTQISIEVSGYTDIQERGADRIRLKMPPDEPKR